MKNKKNWLIALLAISLISASGCKSADGALEQLQNLAGGIPGVVEDIQKDPAGAAGNIVDSVPDAVSGILDTAGNMVQEGLDAVGINGVSGDDVVNAAIDADSDEDLLPSFDIYSGYGESGIPGALDTQPSTSNTPSSDETDPRYDGFDVPPGGYHNAAGYQIDYDVNPDGTINDGSNKNNTQGTTQHTSSPEKSNKLPEYTGQPFVTINNNIPYFPAEALNYVQPFEVYSELDSLGRCGAAFANVCKELMPTTDRESIGSVKPSGWRNAKYDNIDGKYLYNRCHLIGYQLAGENANPKNLITGTRYLNIKGMLQFENWVDDYVDETGNHVLYRVTPVYEGNNLVASGVLMEGYSVEDKGEGIMFCVYCFNVQPGIVINYADGTSYAIEGSGSALLPDEDDSDNHEDAEETEGYYILNTRTMKFHKSTCSLCDSIAENNKAAYVGDRQDCIDDGYTPCGKCNP